ncbi:MAG: FTR1 family protein [Bacteroidota bacterium]|nr:FTR1 family protein [Bacteroidota bacterium]MDP4233160.1 FTR1 family protein [Bacteroidota bacterium]MDP4241695.1 FTR1 family protein [Bacteroidota bacterium]MDP4287353.1 FTR1 family protein [Bacteroidota bacterium]
MLDQLFNQFVIAFREGIEASLIIMTVLVALRKRGEMELRRVAKAGIWSAIAACTIGGIALGSVALVNNHGVELALYSAAAVTVATMVFWMMRAGKKLKGNIESRLDRYGAAPSKMAMLGMFAFVFFMISREGFEMVLMLLAFGAGVGGHFYVLAMLAGIGCAVLLAYGLSRGLVKVNIGKFLQSTAFVLLFFVVQLVFDVLHEAGEGGFIPPFSSQALNNAIDFLHDQVPVFSYAGLVLFFALVIYHFGHALQTGRRKHRLANAGA